MTLRRALAWSVAAHVVLALAAIRHRFFWGGDYAELLHLGEAIALVTFLVVGGLAYVAAARRALDATVKTIVAGGVLLTAIAVLSPPMVSTDLFDYVARGRVEAIHGDNPYVVAPGRYPDDPGTQLAEWDDWPMPYGPISAIVQLGAATIDQVWVSAYAIKLVFALGHVAAAWLAYLVLRTTGERAGRQGLLLFLWNPWLLLENAQSAHNEALMAAFLAAMVLAIARGRMAIATAAFGAAVLTKHGCAVLGPLLLALAWRRGELSRFAIGVAVTAAATALFYLHYFSDPGALEFLGRQTTNRNSSLQHFTVSILGEGSADALVVAGYVLTLALLGLAIPRTRDASSFARAGIAVSLGFILVAMPLFSPWYHLWWLALLPLIGVRATQVALTWLAFVGPSCYLVFVATRTYGLEHQVWNWACGLIVPGIAFAARIRASADQSPAG